MAHIDTLIGRCILLSVALTACGDDLPRGPVTYARHVAPILDEHCARCHRPNGSAPFSLTSYADARPWAEAIAAAAASGRMPPWLPEPGKGDFVGERRLGDREVAMLRAWAEQGAPPGDLARRPDPPAWTSEWELGPPDLVVEMAETYRLAPGARDVFRNFVLAVPVDSTRHVRAVDLRPGPPHVVHHAVMMIDRSGTARRLDAADAEPGYDGMFAASEAQSPDGFFLGWTPGRVPDTGRADLAWRLTPGTDFVVQLHLRPTADTSVVRPRAALYFADRPPDRHAYMLTLGSHAIEIPPGDSAYWVRDTYTLPVEVDVLSVYPHAHYLGKEIQGYAELPDGSRRWLIHIRDWDFNWQDAYRYREPVRVPAGATLVMEVSFDNSSANPHNPFDPPRRIVYGPETTDEMANLFVRVLPADSAARERLDRDFAREFMREEVEGLRFRLGLDPRDAQTRSRLGVALQALGRVDSALAEYRRAIRDKPDYAHAHYNLGTALEVAGDREAAMDAYRRAAALDANDARPRYNLGNLLFARGQVRAAADWYRAALRVDPRHAAAHNNLGNALRQMGALDSAMALYTRAVEIDPEHADAHNNRGNVLRARGDLAGAEAAYRAATAARPDFALARFNLGTMLEIQGAYADAASELRAAVRAAPSWPAPMVSLAWILATSDDPALRAPAEAIDLAERAVELTRGNQPVALDVLAVAHAAAGDFGRAVLVAERALELARASNPTLARTIEQRLALFRQGRSLPAPR